MSNGGLPVLWRAERSPHGPARARLLHLLHPALRQTEVRGQQPVGRSVPPESAGRNLKRHLSSYAAALDLASTASGGAKAIYLSKAQDSCAP